MADQRAAQVLSAFTHTQQLILGHVSIQEKSNEIPAAQQLIEALGLRGRVFTLDAEHCQKKTFEVARATGNHLIVQVKGNQPKLLIAKCGRLPVRPPPSALIGSMTMPASASSGVRCGSSPLRPCRPSGTG